MPIFDRRLKLAPKLLNTVKVAVLVHDQLAPHTSCLLPIVVLISPKFTVLNFELSFTFRHVDRSFHRQEQLRHNCQYACSAGPSAMVPEAQSSTALCHLRCFSTVR
jgi:hypothetical protein